MIAWCILQSIYYSIVSKYNCDKYPLSHKRKQEKMQKKMFNRERRNFGLLLFHCCANFENYPYPTYSELTIFLSIKIKRLFYRLKIMCRFPDYLKYSLYMIFFFFCVQIMTSINFAGIKTLKYKIFKIIKKSISKYTGEKGRRKELMNNKTDLYIVFSVLCIL